MSNVQVQIGGNTVQVQVQSSGFARANAAVTAAAASATAAAASAASAAATLAAAALKANNLSDLASASTARTNLGVAIGSNVQAYSANLDEYAAVNPTAAGLALLDDADASAQRTTLGLGSIATQAASAVAITGGSIAGITDLAVADGGTGASSASAARDNLGLTIGTNVQAYDADLTTWANITPGTGVATALAVNVGSAGAFTTFNGALGTPSSGTLTNATGLPVGTGISGLGTGVATALAVNVGSAGAFVAFNGAGGTPSSLTLTNATGLPVAGGGTGAATAADARTNLAVVGTAALASSTGVSLVGGQLTAGSDLQTQTLTQYVGGGPLMPTMFAGTDQQQITRAITEAGQTRDGGAGQTVQIARKEYDMTASFNVADRVSVAGFNKRGSVLKANAAHTGPYMVTAVNSTSSMFDNCLRDLTLNCNDVASLGGVLSDAWQEGGGMKNVLLQKFRTYGVYFQNGYGGAAVCKIEDCELFGSSAGASPTAGIYVAQIKVAGAFTLSVTNTTIAGDAAVPITRGIHMVNDSLNARSVHFENCTTGIYLDGSGSHVLENITGLSNVTNVVELASTFTGNLTMIGCKRDGATNLLKDNRTGAAKIGNGTPGVIVTDRDIEITANIPAAIHQIVASGVFNGTGTPAMTKGGNGVTSITDNGTGDYTLNLSNTFGNANDILLFASHNGAGGNVRCDAVGTSSCRIYTYDAAGVAADQNQIKFMVVQTQFT